MDYGFVAAIEIDAVMMVTLIHMMRLQEDPCSRAFFSASKPVCTDL
jgi:hypothetical protein